MASPTGNITSTGPNSFYFHRVRRLPMKILPAFTILFALSACADTTEDAPEQALQNECVYHFALDKICNMGTHSVSINYTALSDDERLLTSAEVATPTKRHRLPISDDTSLLDGDTGLIKTEDINFDGHPDLAISTSFGTANLYFDYWVYDPDTGGFISVGNYSQLTIHKENKTLSTTEKSNAVTYKTTTYQWAPNGGVLRELRQKK